MVLAQILITDHEALPIELRVSDDYSTIRQKMERNLTRPDKLHRYATHEAGHLIYFGRTGLLSSPEDAIFGGPTIYSVNGALAYFMAAVDSKRALLSDKDLQYTEELLEKLASVAVAAGVIERAFLGEDEESAAAIKGDEYQLQQHCRKALKRNDIPFKGYSLWPSAKTAVEQHVQHNRDEVKALVEVAKMVIFKQCFGLDSVPNGSV